MKDKTMANKKFLSGIPVIVLVFVLVGFAGCGTTPQVSLPAQAGGGQSGGGSGTENGRAAQLTADLGKAVNGTTVRITDRVEIKTALTVPEGVTLDLTAEGAELELRDGAVLTVNGTVNARGHGDHGKGWVEGSLRTGNGATTINGSGTINLKSKGRLLNIGSDQGTRHLTLDGVTLVGLPDNDQSLVGVNNGGELVLKSGAITGNTRTSDDWAVGGGIEVWRGTFTMEGGTISGNTAKGSRGAEGGGVKIGEEAVFTMSGGTISDNTATAGDTANGGGVNVSQGGTFTMSGGAISGNTSTGGRYGGGGGVALGGAVIEADATFVMQGGIISANTATGGPGGSTGGGVKLGDGGVFIMEGGTIYGKADSLPAGTDAGLANSARGHYMTLSMDDESKAAKWGTGGTYTKGGVSQSGGSDIDIRYIPPANGVGTDETLIAMP
jgi:hypothetical protein